MSTFAFRILGFVMAFLSIALVGVFGFYYSGSNPFSLPLAFAGFLGIGFSLAILITAPHGSITREHLTPGHDYTIRVKLPNRGEVFGDRDNVLLVMQRSNTSFIVDLKLEGPEMAIEVGDKVVFGKDRLLHKIV